jgi:hypothetical protein
LHQINLATSLQMVDVFGKKTVQTSSETIADFERDSLHREVLRTQGKVTGGIIDQVL